MPENRSIYAAVACNLDQGLLQAALPLFAESKVDAIEWSFDALYKVRNIPDWFTDLLHAFSSEKRLIGHGIFFSLFSGRWNEEQTRWLAHLRKVSRHFPFDHITEHFGFMTGSDFHKGAPIGVPYSATTLAIGRDRLMRISEAANCPVGLENLAFSYSPEEVKHHGEFLEKLVEPVNGFIIFDLHNLYCQLHNFSMDVDELLPLYPLHLVREIHISGGSWDEIEGNPSVSVRRDTHDEAVPDAVFHLLKKVIALCPNLKYVVLEQLGTALKSAESQEQFQQDFERMKRIVTDLTGNNSSHPTNHFIPPTPNFSENPLEDLLLHQQQLELSSILENAPNLERAKTLLSQSSLSESDWKCESWSLHMLETALRIAQKWKNGWSDPNKNPE